MAAVRVLHVFGLDGTLHRSTASAEIAAALDCSDEVQEMEEQLARGEMSTGTFALRTHRLWSQKAPLNRELFQEILKRTAWMDGLDRVFADIRSRSEHSMINGTAPSWYMEALRKRFGIDRSGTVLEPSSAVSEVRRVYNRLAVADPHLALVAYGSSSRDVPLFRSLPGIPPTYSMSVSVAVNAQPPRRPGEHDLRAIADVTYDGADMWAAYTRGRRLLHQDEFEAAAS